MRADSLSAFAETADRVRRTRGTLAKTALVAEYLAALPPDALPLGAVYFTGAPFPRVDPRTLSAGSAALRNAALALLPWDEVVFDASVRAVGDVGETLGKLFALDPPRPRARGQQRLTSFGGDAREARAPMTLADVDAAFAALAAERDASAKQRLLEEAWLRMTALEVQYFTKIALGGMRIGLAESLVEEAVATAFSRDVEAVRAANMVSGDVGLAARLAREDRLGQAEFRLFHPLSFMLATPIDAPPAGSYEGWLAEDKFDGIRAQLHAANGRAVLYSRNLEETPEFPEILDAARALASPVVLDGEVLAWRNGRPASFALLQRRLGRKIVPHELKRDVPVRFVAFDVLYANGAATYTLPLAERRRILEALALAEPLAISPTFGVSTAEDVDALFAAARARGNEGVVLKRLDSAYELGKRGRQWLKLKRAFATLDCVVTAVEEGHGKRAGLLSDYTFAVRGDGGELLNVGKAFTGLTDVEIEEMTRFIRRSTVERFGGVHVVEPRVVIEVAFDTVQESARHKSGFALRFPRIVRLRPDKRPEDADSIERVRELHRAAVGDSAA